MTRAKRSSARLKSCSLTPGGTAISCSRRVRFVPRLRSGRPERKSKGAKPALLVRTYCRRDHPRVERVFVRLLVASGFSRKGRSGRRDFMAPLGATRHDVRERRTEPGGTAGVEGSVEHRDRAGDVV